MFLEILMVCFWVDFVTAHSVASVKHGELLALLFGLNMAHNHSFVPLEVKSDCLEVVQATKNMNPCRFF